MASNTLGKLFAFTPAICTSIVKLIENTLSMLMVALALAAYTSHTMPINSNKLWSRKRSRLISRFRLALGQKICGSA
jgi:hypothetical protein